MKTGISQVLAIDWAQGWTIGQNWTCANVQYRRILPSIDLTDRVLEELITPVRKALVAVSRLLGVGTSKVLDPLDKEVFVLLQKQELPEHNIRLVETLAAQPLSQHITNSS